ncbi:DNA repair protein RecO [Candidatus Margulisiibacteriota bacterium]
MSLYKVDAINIKSFDLGEADKLITLYSKEKGKIRAVAKGARRIRSRFGGRLELFVYHQALLAEGKDLDQLSQAEIIEPFIKLRESIDILTTGSYLVWIIDKATEEKHPNRPLFMLLLTSLQALAGGELPDKVRQAFQRKFLEIEGIMPQLAEDLSDKAFIEHFGDYTSIKSFMGKKRK